ncbi:MAG: ABC transporter permease, partial [Chloroflexi bacterium]|nr:ABC transporter permease [Chloroflexota bacterium]
GPARGLWTDAWVRLRRNKLAMLGLALITMLALAALLAEFVAPYPYAKQNLEAILEGPGTAGPSGPYLLGTDSLGRDVFSRLVYGARVSLAVGLFVQVVQLGIGVPLGALEGMYGRGVDNLLMRFTDVVYAFPDLLLIILIRAAMGDGPLSEGIGSIAMVFLAIGLVNWTTVARLVRGQFMALREREFVNAAHALGASRMWIMTHHLLPNSINPLLVSVTFGVPAAIFSEASLSFIGIGVKPPTPSWGSMVQDGYQAIFGFPHLVLAPAAAIAVTMLAFTFLGDGLRDALDPRSRR